MSEEAQEAQEVQETEETVADTEEAQSESVAEPEETEQVTEEPEPIPEKVYTKSELDEIMTRRVAREKESCSGSLSLKNQKKCL